MMERPVLNRMLSTDAVIEIRQATEEAKIERLSSGSNLTLGTHVARRR
jgi:collagenase-like PrtC family protease